MLAVQGCDVTVYAMRDGSTEEDLAAWQPLDPVIVERKGPERLGYGPDLAGALADHDVLHQHGIWQLFSTAVNSWRRRTGAPVMISPRGMLDPWALKNSRLKKRISYAAFERQNLKSAGCMHALALSEARAMRQFGLDNPIAIIPNGIDLPTDMSAPPVSKYGENESARETLLFLGRIHPKKGLQELLLAWRELASRDPDIVNRWHLQIAGWDDGGHLDGLRSLASELPNSCEVSFPGPLHGEAKSQALQSADAFILPSYSEGLPMSVLEAWAFCLPVLMTEECNLPEAFAHDAAIRIHRDPQVLAAELAQHLGDPKLGETGERGRQLTAERFTWQSIASRHIEAYRWMKGEGAKPDFVLAQGEPVPASL